MQRCVNSRGRWKAAACALLGVALTGAAGTPGAAQTPGSYLDAFRFHNAPRAFPNRTVNSALYNRAADQIAHMRSAAAVQPAVSGSRWQFIGPQNFNPPTTPGLPNFAFGPDLVAGRVSSAAFDPDPNSQNILFLTSPTGGVFRSVDSGRTWTALTDRLPALSFSSVTIDPVQHRTVFAGTGDYAGTQALGAGLYKSTDDGASWARVDLDSTGKPLFGQHCIRKVLIDPANHNHIMVALGRDEDLGTILSDSFTNFPAGYIYTSHNGGAPGSWTKSLSTPGWVSNIVANSNHTAFYASVDFMGVYKSTDGDHWTRLTSISAGATEPLVPGISYRLDIAASLLDPNTVYVLSEKAKLIYKSVNGGATFEDSTHNLPANFSYNDKSTWGQAFYDFHIEASTTTVVVNGAPVKKEVVYVGLIDLYQSVNGGTTWASIAYSYTGFDRTHADQQSIAVNPNNPNDVLVCNDGGIYRLTYSPARNQVQFASLNAHLGITQFYDASYDWQDSNRIAGGAQDESMPVALGDLNSWQGIASGDGGYASIAGIPPYPSLTSGNATQYVSTQFALGGGALIQTDTLWTSINGPAAIDVSPHITNENMGFIAPFVTSQEFPDDLYGGAASVHQYIHADPVLVCPTATTPIKLTAVAGKWATAQNPVAVDPFDYITAVAPAPTQREVVYAGSLKGAVAVAANWRGDFTKAVFRRIDNQGNLGGLPVRSVSAVAVSSLNPQRAYVAMSGFGTAHVFRCDDTTVSNPVWINITGNLPDLPVNDIAVGPRDDEQALYLATDLGVFQSQDAGATWSSMNGMGLPNVQVNKITYVANTGFLEATTFGRGLWRLPVGKNIPLRFYPRLSYYRGDKSRLGVRIEMFHADQPVYRDPRPIASDVPCAAYDPFRLKTPPVEVAAANLTAGGWFNAMVSSQGSYDVFVSIPGYLRKRVTRVLTGDQSTVSSQMFAGDVAHFDTTIKKVVGGADNIIDDSDVAYVSASMGQTGFGNPADLDGDGIVTQRDLDIVKANVGQRGD